jgi:hypothetical protein
MDTSQVQAAISQDFRPAADDVVMLENPTKKARIIPLRLALLEPGPGPAGVSYIFGATSRRLKHINVVWKSDGTPPDDIRNKIAAVGVQMANSFQSLAWKPGTTTSGEADGGKGVVLFAGIDPGTAAVDVRVSGVATNGLGGVAAKPEGVAQLLVSYIADINKPGVYAIKPKDF